MRNLITILLLFVVGCESPLAKRVGEEQAKKEQQVKRKVESEQKSDKETKTKIEAVKPQPQEEKIADFNQVVRQRDFQIQIMDVKVDRVALKDYESKESADKLLIIEIEVRNLSSTKIINYSGYGARLLDMDNEDRARVTDNFGNAYKRCFFGIGTKIVGQVSSNTSIYPGKFQSDVIVFEPPVEACDFLILELPADTFGGNGVIKYRIPSSLWKSNSSGLIPPLNIN